MGVVAVLVSLYFLVIPLVWSLCVKDMVGVSEAGNKMEISGVCPWPGRHLYCYEGTWVTEGQTNVARFDDRTITVYSPGTYFHGFCYVDEMTVKGIK
jgi:hypothetical protein